MAPPVSDQWVVNASPLICLGEIGRLGWLKQLARDVVIPAGVAEEINSGPPDDPARQWLQAEGAALVGSSPEIDATLLAWDLGRGESEVLAWVRAHPSFTAVLDDRAARRCADVMNVPVCGTLGIALRAKKRQIAPALAPVLDELVKAGLHISPALRSEALRLAGEG